MENSTDKEDYSKTIQVLFCADRSPGNHWHFLSALKSLFSITTFPENTLILISCLIQGHFSTSAIKTLVALPCNHWSIGRPYFRAKHCFKPRFPGNGSSIDWSLFLLRGSFDSHFYNVICSFFANAVHIKSVDTLLALILRFKYRQLVTSKRLKAIAIFYWIPA